MPKSRHTSFAEQISGINKKDIVFILIIAFAGIFFRLFYFIDYHKLSVFPVMPYSDSSSYLLWAQDILSGDFWGSKVFMKWPLYAYVLAFLFKISANNILSVYMFQFMLGAINCALVYFIAKTIFNRTVAFIAGLLCAWYGLFMFYDGLLVYTSLSLFLNSLVVLFALRIQNSLNIKKLFLLGVFLGICAIAQANIVIPIVISVIWMLWQDKSGLKKLVVGFLSFLLGLSLIIGGVALRNYLMEKDFVLIAGNTGINFYLGNNPEATGTFYFLAGITSNQQDMFRDARIIASHKMNKPLKPSLVSKFWFNKAFGFIGNNPGAWLKLFLRKVVYVFGPKEFVHDIEYHFIASGASIFKVMFMDMRLIFPFAVIGMFLGIKRFKAAFILYVLLITLALSISVFFVSARYRIVIVPYLMIFAGVAFYGIWDALRNKKYLKTGVLCGILAIVSILPNYWYLSAPEAEGNSAVFEQHLTKSLEYNNSLDYINAVEELKLARKIQPDNSWVVFRMGLMYYYLNDFKEAENKFKEAISINPLAVDAYYNLGFLYNQQLRSSEAIDVLRKAVALDPQDARAHFELGVAYKTNGSFDESRKEFMLTLENLHRSAGADREIVMKELADLGK